MANQIGVWIDHRKALIVSVAPDGEHTSLVISHAEKHPRRAGDASDGPYEALQVPADNRRQRALTKHLNVYYDAVIAAIHAARGIYLFGPGESKGELKKRLIRLKPGARVMAVESADKMTDRQVTTQVRRFFKVDAPRREPKLRPQLK